MGTSGALLKGKVQAKMTKQSLTESRRREIEAGLLARWEQEGISEFLRPNWKPRPGLTEQYEPRRRKSPHQDAHLWVRIIGGGLPDSNRRRH